MDRRLHAVQDRLAEQCAQTFKTVQGSVSAVTSYFQKDVPLKHETDHESLLQRAFALQYNGKKMKKLEKEYTVIRKEEQEEQVEIRKLRNENRLLKQRVENLEKESETLANRLIEGQVLNAQYAEESYQLKRENNSLKKQLEDLDCMFKNTQIDTDQTENIHTSDFIVTSNHNEVEVLRETVNRLSTENRRLQSTPNSEIAALHEELTLVKMRDAEAQVNLNELRQRIADLNREWQLHDSLCKTARETDNSPRDDTYDLIAHELISLKMREAQTDCDNKLLSQKIMDIETQKQVLHNQIKRQDEESQRIRLELDECRIRENELRIQLVELKNQMNDGLLRQKEDSMMLRIREAESTQTIGDLRQKIAELEVQNQELITRGQIMDDTNFQDKFAELQDEVMDLRLIQSLQRRQSLSTDPLTRLDYEESEDESFPSSPLTLSNPGSHCLSSSLNIHSNSFTEPNHLRQSTSSSAIDHGKAPNPTSSTELSSSHPSSSLSTD
ncbi:unnamed protein product [Adineta ricciae]|uniref:Uncharacterized protein n=1 Tax=Adineta ricciae TaxID=249248 RepID=A0A815L7Y7_ADIRI|nr:unnamed protein product [Adineta ricciae]